MVLLLLLLLLLLLVVAVVVTIELATWWGLLLLLLRLLLAAAVVEVLRGHCGDPAGRGGEAGRICRRHYTTRLLLSGAHCPLLPPVCAPRAAAPADTAAVQRCSTPLQHTAAVHCCSALLLAAE